MKQVRISVIMPVFNGKKFLKKSIESVLNQTFRDFELIVVNDCSTDNSLQLIKGYIERDNRIVLLNSKRNIGPTASRNKALKIANGKYIAIMDSDDISLPGRLLAQYEFLKNHRDVFLIGGKAIIIDEQGKVLWEYPVITNEQELKREMKFFNGIIHSTVMFRNDNRHFYREKFLFAEDYDFYLRLISEKKKILNLDKIFSKYRYNSKSISSKQRVQMALFSQIAIDFFMQRRKRGADEYGQLNPSSILNTTINDIEDRKILIALIKSTLGNLDVRKAREIVKKYNSIYGPLNRYSCILFLPKIFFKYYLKLKHINIFAKRPSAH